LNDVLETVQPDEAAVEETFVNKNAASTLKLGVARGVVLLAPAERGLPVAEYSANLVKKFGRRRRSRREGAGADDGPAAVARLRDSSSPMQPTRWPSRSAMRTTPIRCASGLRRRW